MEKKRLVVVETDNKPASTERIGSRRAKRQEAQAKYERMWLTAPGQFDPTRNCMERERLERTWQLINEFVDLNGKRAVDLGCGSGHLARRLKDAGAIVQAVDISSNALKELKKWHIDAIQDTLPDTSLPDGAYDVVVSTDVIAELPRSEHRLYMAELARLVTAKGYVVCSTPIDIHSEDALQQLAELAHTEFDVLKWVYSYHALYVRLKAFVEAVPIPYITHPLARLLRQNRTLLLKLEKICHFFSDVNGISHAIFIAQRRPLEIPDMDHRPVERPKKREVWE